MPEVFEQQPKESAKAFAAFCEYLNLGPERSLAAVGEKLGKSEGLMERWSRKFDWVGRVAAHGAHMALVERQATEALARSKSVEWETRREKHREKEWRLSEELIEAGEEALRRWKANEKRCGSLEGIARMLDLASKLGRLASGMPTDHTEVSGEITATLEVEWELALKKVYGKEKVVGPAALPAPQKVDG